MNSSVSSSTSSLRTAPVLESSLDDPSETEQLALLQGRAAPAFLLREDYCGACGHRHANPRLLDLYSVCDNCLNCVREPVHLRNRYIGIEQLSPLDIVFATYGHYTDAGRAVDVTEVCRSLVAAREHHDRISLKTRQDLETLFGDPCPGDPKQLRIRYRIKLRFAITVANVFPSNHLEKTLLLIAPTSRLLNILRASYGHPRGRSTTGRMSYDVTEHIQGLVDLNGGSYVSIGSDTRVNILFGDPCPGYTKDLRVEYDIDGQVEVVVFDETRGYIRSPKDILINKISVVAPLIYIESAFFGITPTGRRDKLLEIAKKLNRIDVIEYRMLQELPVAIEDMALKRMKAKLQADQQLYRSIGVRFIDISKKLQLLADKNIFYLKIDRNSFDPNQLFSNPCPNEVKLIEINVRTIGHDSERLTSSNEITLSGYPRNFIAGSAERFLIQVEDDSNGKGVMETDIDYNCKLAFPPIVIQSAVYGYMKDLSQVVDVTREVQGLVSIDGLKIPRTLDLNSLFTNPCPGSLKQLRIKYISRGMNGSIRVREKDGFLNGNVQLGYVPTVSADDGG